MTLLAGYTDIQREFGLYTGCGRDPDEWEPDDDDDFAGCLRDGITQFLTAGGHKWRFLRPIQSLILWPTLTTTLVGTPTYVDPVSTVTAAAGDFRPLMVGKDLVFATSGNSYPIAEYVSTTVVKVTGNASGETAGDDVTITADGDYHLAAAFSGLSDPLWFIDTNGTTYGPVHLSSPNAVMNERGRSTSTGRPCQAAMAPLEPDQTIGPRWMLMIQPTPQQEYTLKFQGRYTPEQLSEALPYLVAPPYTRALLESVLSIAENKFRESETLHKLLYQQALAEAVTHDKGFYSPKQLGLNLDPSAEGWQGTTECRRRTGYVSVNGIVPGIG